VSGETEDRPSGWTTDTLRMHLEHRIDDQKRLFHEELAALRVQLNERHAAQQSALQSALFSAEKAVAKAETAAEKRFDSVNEFRAQLADQASRFMPRTEAEAAIARNAERIKELSDTAAAHLPRIEYNAAHDRLVEQVRDLTERVNRSEGKGLGFSASWIIALSVIAAIGTVVSLYLAFR
jgi:hypothetical protein